MNIKCACGERWCEAEVRIERGLLFLDKAYTSEGDFILNETNTQQLIKALQEELGRMTNEVGG